MELVVRIGMIQPVEVDVPAGKDTKGNLVTVKEPRKLVGVKMRSFEGIPCDGRFEVLVPADHKLPKLGSDVKLTSGGGKKAEKEPSSEPGDVTTSTGLGA